MSQRPEFSIDVLNIKLPSGFEHRADAIIREAARRLAAMPIAGSVEMEILSAPVVRTSVGETNGAIARRIAEAIHRQAMSGARQGGSDAD